jgi:hypothetical protein
LFIYQIIYLSISGVTSYRRDSSLNQSTTTTARPEEMINTKELQDVIDTASTLHDRNERNSRYQSI